MVAGSILPVSLYNGQLYFLFGKENKMEDSARGFSDFGGGLEGNETPMDTALREGGEELSGFLGDGKNIKKLIRKNGGVFKLVHNDYNVHMFYMDYDPILPFYFTNFHQFMWTRMNKNTLNSSKLYEKQEIRWFSETELKTKRNLFRPFYREIVDKYVENLPKIREFIKQKSSRLGPNNCTHKRHPYAGLKHAKRIRRRQTQKNK